MKIRHINTHLIVFCREKIDPTSSQQQATFHLQTLSEKIHNKKNCKENQINTT